MSRVPLAVPLVEVSCSDDGSGEDVGILNVILSKPLPHLDPVTTILLSPKSMTEGLSLPDFAAQLALRGARE
jgi:hypothetical protein